MSADGTEWWIAKLWDGGPARRDERVRVVLARHEDGLSLEIDAPDHGDPPPSAEPGPTPGLWDHEVVELFLLGADDRYLEVEIGPGGHHWVAELRGRRDVWRSELPLDVTIERQHGRWTARTTIPAAWLPPRLSRGNAYAIHGVADARRFLAWHPVSGAAPDFHRLEQFPLLPDALLVDRRKGSTS